MNTARYDEVYLCELEPYNEDLFLICRCVPADIDISRKEKIGVIDRRLDSKLAPMLQMFDIDASIYQYAMKDIGRVPFTVIQVCAKSKNERDLARRVVQMFGRTMCPEADAAAEARPCCATTIGKYCSECGLKRGDADQAELITRLRKHIASAAASLPRRDCVCKSYQYVCVDYDDGPSWVEPDGRQRLRCPPKFNLRKAIADAAPGRKFKIGKETQRPVPHDEYVTLPQADDKLAALQAQLAEPVFIYGSGAEVIFTASQLEAIIPGLKHYKNIYHSWYDTATQISREYANIHCLMCVIHIHSNRLYYC